MPSRTHLSRRAFVGKAALLGASIAAPPSFAADAYPSKPVRVLMSYGAGSGTDTVGRVVTQQLSKQIGMSFYIENRPGAGGIIGNEMLTKAAPDGYTLSVVDLGTVITANLYKSLPYNTATDYTPITQFARTPIVLTVNASLNIKTMADLIAYARANPGKLFYGSSGVGGSIQVWAELFKLGAKVDIKHIPYDGGGTMITAALRNDIQVLVTAIATTKQYVQSGQLRPLGVTTDGKRAPSMPDVPSMAELGIPGMSIYAWQGLAGPRGLPREIVDRLQGEVAKALKEPAVKDWFTAQDAEIVGSTPQEFSEFFLGELRRWGDVIKNAGIELPR